MARYHEDLAHWADQNAQKIVSTRRNADGSPKERFVCASGITPSGTVHIGNFREIISVDLVHRALLDRGVVSRFIYSWDDYDVFRKIPKNMPNPEKLESFLRWPIVDVPDPRGTAESYARANELAVETVLPNVGIEPEYLYQAEAYRKATYAQGIRLALEHRQTIREILDEHRSTPLEENWWPVSVFSSFSHRDTTTILSWDGEWGLTYRCDDSGKEETLDIRNSSGVKLFWRIDWPMRWAYEQVDFEPAGKEHHSAGGSFDTAKTISDRVYGYPAPVTFKYDFISIKGQGGKISSSLGNVISIAEVLEVYQPEIVRYLFAGTRPNAEFAISFDLDVIKIYEDYDRCERIYYGLEDVNDKRRAKEGRIYELSQTTTKEMGQREALDPAHLVQVPFRHLCNLLLINNGDVDAALEAFPGIAEAKAAGTLSDQDYRRAETRAVCAWNWINQYAPEDFRFTVKDGSEAPVELSSAQFAAVASLKELISGGLDQYEDKELQNLMYDISRKAEVEPKEFFTVMYHILVGKDQGPRLAGFLKTLGRQRLEQILASY